LRVEPEEEEEVETLRLICPGSTAMMEREGKEGREPRLMASS
jgi:hypothetical protein